jgi:hypothetical protein
MPTGLIPVASDLQLSQFHCSMQLRAFPMYLTELLLWMRKQTANFLSLRAD